MFAFLSVCPIQFHLHVLMITSTGCCLVFFHGCTLLMVSGHFIPKIFIRELFTKTWNGFIDGAVSLQVSHPYSPEC
jgi:hypothetical protein